MGLRSLLLVACACVASAFVPVMPLRSVAPSCSRVTDVQMIVSATPKHAMSQLWLSSRGAGPMPPLSITR